MLKQCIRTSKPCLNRGCQELSIAGDFKLCCAEEIEEEQEIVQSIIDAIDDSIKDQESLRHISCKLSYGANTINQNNEEDLIQVLPIIRRFSQLIYEFQEKILHDDAIGDLVYSFAHEIQRWLGYNFFEQNNLYQHPIQAQSIIADMNTIEMALGLCIIDECSDDSLDDLFF